MRIMLAARISVAFALSLTAVALAGQVPFAAANRPISHQDRVYAAEQYSNTISVTDPKSGKLLGVIRLGEVPAGYLSPLYRGQLLVHGLGFSPDGRTLDAVSIGTNSVTFIDTATNKIKHVTYVGRAPHEAFFTPDGREVCRRKRPLAGERYERRQHLIARFEDQDVRALGCSRDQTCVHERGAATGRGDRDLRLGRRREPRVVGAYACWHAGCPHRHPCPLPPCI